jgi:hypothetical protein
LIAISPADTIAQAQAQKTTIDADFQDAIDYYAS